MNEQESMNGLTFILNWRNTVLNKLFVLLFSLVFIACASFSEQRYLALNQKTYESMQNARVIKLINDTMVARVIKTYPNEPFSDKSIFIVARTSSDGIIGILPQQDSAHFMKNSIIRLGPFCKDKRERANLPFTTKRVKDNKDLLKIKKIYIGSLIE